MTPSDPTTPYLSDHEKMAAIQSACSCAKFRILPGSLASAAECYTLLGGVLTREVENFFNTEVFLDSRGAELAGEQGLRGVLDFRLRFNIDIKSKTPGGVFVRNTDEVVDEVVRSIKRATEQAIQREERIRQ